LIVFAPRYDPATEGNLAVALRILPEGCRALLSSREGTFWWGYTGRVTAPDSTEAVLPLFVEIFAYIRDAFPGADSAASCGDVLTRISELCHEAEVRVDDLLDTGTTLDVGSIYLCLLQLWQRLRVWLPGGMEPLLHPEAPPPALLI